MATLKQSTIDGSLTVKQVLNLAKLEVENTTKINLLSQKQNTVIGETANNINFFDRFVRHCCRANEEFFPNKLNSKFFISKNCIIAINKILFR